MNANMMVNTFFGRSRPGARPAGTEDHPSGSRRGRIRDPGGAERTPYPMPSTGAAKAEQQRQRRARRAEEQKTIRAERDRVRELEARLARSEKLDPYIAAVEATVDRNLALCQLAPLEAENARLWAEVERLSSLAFPMTVYPPSRATTRSEF